MSIIVVESRSNTVGPINLDTKYTGARSAGNLHAACERERGWNRVCDKSEWGDVSKRSVISYPMSKGLAPTLEFTEYFRQRF